MQRFSSSQDRIISHLQTLVRFQTTNLRPDEIARCFAYIERCFGPIGFVPQSFQIPSSSMARPLIQSCVWTMDGRKDPTVLLYAHLDVVSAPDELFEVQFTDNLAVGRGVFDMKFALAAYIETLTSLSAQGVNLASIGVMVVSDEEIGGAHGAKFLIEQAGYRPSVVFLPDGGPGWHIVEQAKGLLHLRIETSGQAAHAARPWDGINAIDKIIDMAVGIRNQFSLPTTDDWNTTVTFTELVGGEGTDKNQVPDQASLFLDIRFIPNDEASTITELILKATSKVDPDTVVTTVVSKGAFRVDRENPYIELWRSLIVPAKLSGNDVFIKENGTADHHYFAASGIPVVVSSPDGGDIHSSNEWIDLDSLAEFVDTLRQWLVSALALSQ